MFRTKTGKESSDGSSSLESGCALPGLYLYYATYNDLFLMYPPRCDGRAGLRSRKRGNGNCCRVGAFGEYLYRRNYCPGRNDVVLATLAKTENRPVGARFQRARLNDCIDFLAGTGRVGNAPLLAGSRPSISVARKQGELVRRYKWAAPGVPATVRLTAGRRFLFRTQPCVVVLVKLVLHLPGMLEFLPSPLQLGAGLVFFESFPGLLVGLRSLLTSGNRQRRNESV